MTNKSPVETSVLVAGTGPAGLASALAFHAAGFAVVLVGPPANRADRRTTALMIPALRLLERLGVLAALEDEAAPLRAMRIVDATRRLVRSPTVTFHAGEIDEAWFGLNIPNAVLNGALEDAVVAAGIDWRRTTVAQWQPGPETVTADLADGTTVAARLAVGADGRASPAREAAGITVSARAFPQAALVTCFAHDRPHGDISNEFHTETGPFTQVPLPGRRSSLVWVVRPAEADELAALPAPELSRRIEEKMQSMLGSVTVDTPPQVYPLSVSLPRSFAARRIALVGEAAHAFPPIGAQGLNLGLRDVDQLVEIASEWRDDPGASAALSAYSARRRPDILARTGAVSLLNRSLLSDLLPAQLLRGVGLGALGGFAPLRALFMREGLSPGSGFSALVSSLRKQVGRQRPAREQVD